MTEFYIPEEHMIVARVLKVIKFVDSMIHAYNCLYSIYRIVLETIIIVCHLTFVRSKVLFTFKDIADTCTVLKCIAILLSSHSYCCN